MAQKPDMDTSPPGGSGRKRRISADDPSAPTPGSEPKKSRGRPRVEPDDGSAADRRRTQIRLAQRAYRARAENKKNGLEQKASKFEGIIAEMHSTLTRFHDMAVQSGLAALDPNLANELHATMQEFERMAAEARQEAAEQREAADKANANHGSDSPPTNNDGVGPAPLTVADLARPSVLKASETTSTESVPSTNRTWPYPTPYEDHQEVRAPGSVPTAPMRSSYPEPPATTAQDMNRLRIPAKTQALLRPDMFLQSPGSLELSAPITYSFLESSFSRRLHRASLEKAQWLLSQPKLCEPVLKQMFRVSYRYLNLCDIRDQIDDRLSKNSYQPLESFYDFPYRNFGGAGTHFTRSGLSSSTIPILPRPIGPGRPQMNAEDYDSKHVDDIEGLSGEWFSPDDVEGYLYEVRGIRVGEMASRIETEMLVESPILDHLPSTTVPAFGGDMANMPGTYVSMDNRNGTMFDGSQLSTAPRINLSTDLTTIKQEDVSPPHVGNVPTPMPDGLAGTTLLRRNVTIDIERLIEELAGTAVCLGRFPGFRRINVERALQVSVM